jgi:serine/threonine protein phosphatase 1
VHTLQRILAIGDVHGCRRALDAVVRAVDPQPGDVIVTLGDYVDRGPDSAGVINYLIRLSRSHTLIPLRGNHEELMLRARESDEHLDMWRNCGGDATLASYAPSGDEAEDGRLADVPDEHWDFLENRCVDLHETATHFFVHGGVRPDIPLDAQSPLVMRWQKFDDAEPHASGKVMICGHTQQKSRRPRDVGHAICIDTSAYKRDGLLTCLDVTSGMFAQADERGSVRWSRLDSHRP